MDDTNVTSLVETKVIALVSTKPFVHTDEGFTRRTSDCSVLTGYVDYVAFRL